MRTWLLFLFGVVVLLLCCGGGGFAWKSQSEGGLKRIQKKWGDLCACTNHILGVRMEFEFQSVGGNSPKKKIQNTLSKKKRENPRTRQF